MKKCATDGCYHKIEKRNYCNTCRKRKYRQSNPIKASYQQLRDNAKRRGKFFDLTLEEFASFCYKTDYIQGKGKTATSYSIDCIENEKGYTKNNIRVLPLGENSKKGTKKLEYDYINREFIVVTLTPDMPCEGPF